MVHHTTCSFQCTYNMGVNRLYFSTMNANYDAELSLWAIGMCKASLQEKQRLTAAPLHYEVNVWGRLCTTLFARNCAHAFVCCLCSVFYVNS